MSVYREFEIETFQLGRDQWHACFRPIDRSKGIVIDGITLGVVNLGFAWPTPDAASRTLRVTLNGWLVGALLSREMERFAVAPDPVYTARRRANIFRSGGVVALNFSRADTS
jgi:hypothetical protein